MIKNTHEHNPDGTLSAYKRQCPRSWKVTLADVFFPSAGFWEYDFSKKISIFWNESWKRITTNSHFTILLVRATVLVVRFREWQARTGLFKQKAGLSGYTVSDLKIPGFETTWREFNYGKLLVSLRPLDSWFEGPIGVRRLTTKLVVQTY